MGPTLVTEVREKNQPLSMEPELKSPAGLKMLHNNMRLHDGTTQQAN